MYYIYYNKQAALKTERTSKSGQAAKKPRKPNAVFQAMAFLDTVLQIDREDRESNFVSIFVPKFHTTSFAKAQLFLSSNSVNWARTLRHWPLLSENIALKHLSSVLLIVLRQLRESTVFFRLHQVRFEWECIIGHTGERSFTFNRKCGSY